MVFSTPHPLEHHAHHQRGLKGKMNPGAFIIDAHRSEHSSSLRSMRSSRSSHALSGILALSVPSSWKCHRSRRVLSSSVSWSIPSSIGATYLSSPTAEHLHANKKKSHYNPSAVQLFCAGLCLCKLAIEGADCNKNHGGGSIAAGGRFGSALGSAHWYPGRAPRQVKKPNQKAGGIDPTSLPGLNYLTTIHTGFILQHRSKKESLSLPWPVDFKAFWDSVFPDQPARHVH